MAPAQPHATSVAVYPALFFFFKFNQAELKNDELKLFSFRRQNNIEVITNAGAA